MLIIMFWKNKNELRVIDTERFTNINANDFISLEKLTGNKSPEFNTEEEGWDFITNNYPEYAP